jgi:uncharacterized protein YegP (UPF0339 family)
VNSVESNRMFTTKKKHHDGDLRHELPSVLQHPVISSVYRYSSKNQRITAMAILTITVHRTVADRHYFRLRNIGGGLLLTSKDYGTLSKCLNEIYCLQAYRDFVMEEEGLDRQYRFSLQSAWGNTIAISPPYISIRHMVQDMQLIKENIHEAQIEDHCTRVKFFRAVKSKI